MRAQHECPVCQARFRGSRLCSRCGADLGPLMIVAVRAWRLREEARDALARGHVLLNCPDDAGHYRRIEKAGFLPRLDLGVAHEQATDVARDRGENRLSSGLAIAVAADDEAGALFGAFLVGEHEFHEDDVAATKACHRQRPWGCPKGPPGQDQRVRSTRPDPQPPSRR